MLATLAPFYRKISGLRVTPVWNNYIKMIDEKCNQLTNRYLNMQYTPITNGTKYLEAILRIADPEDMAKKKNNFEILTTYIPNILDDIKSISKMSDGGKSYNNMFTFSSGNHGIPEYLTTPDDNDWLRILPMTDTNYSQWKHIQPLSLLWYGSMEQTFDLFTTGNLRFHTDPPIFVSWCLDVPSLILKAVQYYRSSINNKSHLHYLHIGVLPYITAQLKRLWLFKLHHSAVKVVSGELKLEWIIEQYQQRQTQYSYVGPKLEELLREMTEMYLNVKQGAYRALNVLSLDFYPDPVTSEMHSFTDLCEELHQHVDVSHFVRYQALRMMRDMHFLEYLLGVYRLNPDDPQSIQFLIRFKQLLVRFKTTVTMAFFKNPYHKEYFEGILNNWYRIFGI